jgi:phosphatidylglycerol---prolipoprotein diacylglyceryl transferase
MRRVLFEWRGLRVYSYPFMLYVGILCGIAAGTHWADSRHLNAIRVYIAMLVLVVPAIVGSRLLFVVSHWRLYSRQPHRIWQRSEGGAALYGGLIAAFLLSLALLKVLTIPVGAFWDAATITILVGMVFTKVGCLLNGCCAGRPTESRIGMRLPNVNGIWCRRVPSQIFETVFAMLLLLAALAFWNRLPFPGAVFLFGLFSYAAGRWMLESCRETVDQVAGLSLHRAISAGLAACSLVGLFLLWPQGI